MTFTPDTPHREQTVSQIITGFWPHRMSQAAARAIDAQYRSWVRRNTSMEYRVVIEKVRGPRFSGHTRSLKDAKRVCGAYREQGLDAHIEQRLVSAWSRR